MAAGRAKRVAGRDDPRADHQPFVDRLFVRDVVVILRPDVAHGGEAGAQHGRGIADALHRPKTIGELQARIAAIKRRAVEMDMHVDETGYQRDVTQIEPLGIGRDGSADRDDPPVGDGDHRALNDRPLFHVEHARGGDDHCFGSSGSGRDDCGSGKQYRLQETPPMVPTSERAASLSIKA
jgi:hypothetical protein